jgi:DNA-nicking Smr family endonuclease
MDRELNLRGRTVKEARSLLKRFLEEAAGDNCTRVKVIHGKGMRSPDGFSVVRDAVTMELEKALVEGRIRDFRLGNIGEGGAGVTLIWL